MLRICMRQKHIVHKIWNLCNILRGDGITYYQYISELSYLLFLKIAEENGSEKLLPKGYRWKDLENHSVSGLIEFYQEMLTHLGTSSENEVVKSIYAFPTTVFSHSENLKAVINGISEIDWYEVGQDDFGDLYSGLIDRSAQDTRSSAGQYFTPRPLVDAIVNVIKPKPGEIIQDPATGSGGFLVSADSYIRSKYSVEDYQKNLPTYQGVEIEKNTRRICLMNTFLHSLNANIIYGDALTNDADELLSPDVILANPPFGTKAGGKRPLRKDLSYPNCNKQLAFLQHIYLTLKTGGRAAVVLPDNILFEEGVAKLIRSELMELCDLHTILRLPTGIFHATNIKTNVLFFSKLENKKTTNVWIYDMRANMPKFNKSLPLDFKDFSDFIDNYGEDPYGLSPRTSQYKNERFCSFSRQEIEQRDDNLDIIWLREDSVQAEPVDIDLLTTEIMMHLKSAMSEIEIIMDELTAPNQ